MSMTTYPLRCQCGTVRAVLAHPARGNRVVCYCHDCRAFAHVLDQASRVLDERGGSEISQVLPKNLTFTQGTEALACLRLTPKGLLRWHSACCRTPIGNTLATGKMGSYPRSAGRASAQGGRPGHVGRVVLACSRRRAASVERRGARKGHDRRPWGALV